MTRTLRFLARLAAIAGTLFVSIFALDVFQPGVPPLEIALALFMHLLPSMVLAILVVIAWKRAWIGAIIFFAVAAVPFLLLDNILLANVMLAAPFLVAALLFLATALREQRQAQET